VPFTVTISRTERDLGLQGKLLAELPGVLAWIVEGARRYLTDGLEPPDAVEVATESYRADENTIGRFVDDRCVLGDGLWVAVSDLYAAWRGWCTRNGEEHGTQTSFGRRIGELCDVAGAPRFPADRLGTGVRVRTGLRLRPSDDFDGWAS
jgi:putative DNA primase/helicase